MNKDILKSIVVTEKAASAGDKENKYTFVVSADANKAQVKKAIEEVYETKVKGVNILNVPSKTKRSMAKSKDKYYKKPYKKAIVELQTGQTLKIYEGSTK